MVHEKMEPIELLKKEHRVILKMLSIVERICGAEREWNDGLIEDTQNIVAFFRKFVDRCHHGKEENLLFPVMEGRGDENLKAAIREMMDQHVRGRNLVARMAQAIDDAREGKTKSTTDFCKAATEYIAFLRGHIDIEDSDLFITARSVIPAGVREKLWEEFERVEDEEIGEGVHEEFEELVKKLE